MLTPGQKIRERKRSLCYNANCHWIIRQQLHHLKTIFEKQNKTRIDTLFDGDWSVLGIRSAPTLPLVRRILMPVSTLGGGGISASHGR